MNTIAGIILAIGMVLYMRYAFARQHRQQRMVRELSRRTGKPYTYRRQT